MTELAGFEVRLIHVAGSSNSSKLYAMLTKGLVYPQSLGRESFWQLNHESPVSAITAVSPLSISC